MTEIMSYLKLLKDSTDNKITKYVINVLIRTKDFNLWLKYINTLVFLASG